MALETVILEKKDGVAKIILNRPEALNALDAKIREDLAAAIAQVRQDPEVRAVVLAGAGRAFCAGGDVRFLATEPKDALHTRARLKALHHWLLDLVHLEKPVIAAVHGYAVGAGCNLALACDIIIAAEGTKFSQAFIRLGLVPDAGGMYFLPRAVGLAKAKEMAFTGDLIDAREAERLGLVNQVVPAAELEKAAMELAARLARGPTKALALAKSILNRSLELNLDDVLELEAQAQGLCFATEDHQEGVRAFLEKREPRFQGK